MFNEVCKCMKSVSFTCIYIWKQHRQRFLYHANDILSLPFYKTKAMNADARNLCICEDLEGWDYDYLSHPIAGIQN